MSNPKNYHFNYTLNNRRKEKKKMLDVIEVLDNVTEAQINADKLEFIIENALNELEQTEAFLIEKGEISFTSLSVIRRACNYLNIALDYKTGILNGLEKASEELTREQMEEGKEAEGN